MNVRAKRADGIWNLSSANYESAEYAAETDTAVIMAAAERGGANAWVPEQGSDVTKIDVQLGTPDLVFLRTWQYVENGVPNELLVPALRFPTTVPSGATDAMPPEFIVIPLVKELLVAPQGGGMGGGPTTYMKGGASGVATPAIEVAPPMPAVLR